MFFNEANKSTADNSKLILVINPGSTSTKLALFNNSKKKFSCSITHSPEQIASSPTIWDQFSFRSQSILETLKEHSCDIESLSAIVGRGGLLKPLTGGTYLVNETMIGDAKEGLRGQHASNLGCALADAIAKKANLPAYIVDPVCVDEFEPLARYSGTPSIERRSLSHALNIHAVGRKAAQRLSIDLATSRFIVVHLGGGISVCALKNGKIIDVNDASSSGPFAPERSGDVPLLPFIDICFSGDYSQEEIKKMVMGKGGLYAYLGTTNALEIEERIKQGDKKAQEVYLAMAYQVAKEIGAMATVLKGKVMAIAISGGLARSSLLIQHISDRVSHIARVVLFPGEFELEAMAEGALRVLNKEEKAKIYR